MNSSTQCRQWAAWFRTLCAVMMLLASTQLMAQKKVAQDAPAPPDSLKKEYIDILFSGVFESIIEEGDTIVKLKEEVELRQDTVYLFCDSATVKNKTFLSATGNFILKQGDSILVYSDSATYSGKEKVAELYGNVALIKGLQKLFTERLTYDTQRKIASYHTGATMTDDTTFITSKTGYFHAETNEMFFKDSVRVLSPDFSLKSDTLRFDAKNKIVFFTAPTLITIDSAKIYTESGFYDINNKKAQFTLNPQYQKNDQKAWARAILYDGNTGDVSLLVNAHFEDSNTVANAQYIRHNEDTQVTILAGNAFIQDESRLINGDTVVYDAKKGTYSTRGRSTIVDGAKTLEADFVDYDKEQDVGIAKGNIIWQDSVENLVVLCEYAEHAASRNYLKASGGRPLLMKVLDKDTLFLSADTLVSYEVLPAVDTARQVAGDTMVSELLPARQDSTINEGIEPLFDLRDTSAAANPPAQPADTTMAAPRGDTLRMILAYHDVRIFKSDMQALCDSLSYSSADSIFRMFRQPVMWSDSSQFTADTVLMQLANDQIDKVFLRQNSFIVNTPDELFFNQISGKNSTAIFEDGQLRNVRVSGNAESVYYALDDEDAYIGVNKAICSEMLLLFAGNKVDGIVFYAQPQASLMPMKSTDHQALKLKGFQWRYAERPKGVEDLLRSEEKSSAKPEEAPAGNKQRP